VSSLAVIIHHI